MTHNSDQTDPDLPDKYPDKDMGWESRRLCADGNCIGVIGMNGCCRVCGLPAGENQEEMLLSVGAYDMRSAQDPEAMGEEVHDLEGNETDWENRVLCEDGNCIGVMGADGLCKACGRLLKK